MPPRGGKGYSDDDEERRLEWELDDAMRRRTKERGSSLDNVVVRVQALQEYRAANGITGRLDERFGKPFDADEWVVVEKLLDEGRNVTSIAPLRTGDTTPDLAVDARLSEIKASTGFSAESFATRVNAVWMRQGAPYVFVNATQSGIARADLQSAMQNIVSRGNSMYIRIVGNGYDTVCGKW